MDGNGSFDDFWFTQWPVENIPLQAVGWSWSKCLCAMFHVNYSYCVKVLIFINWFRYNEQEFTIIKKKYNHKTVSSSILKFKTSLNIYGNYILSGLVIL